MKRRAIKKGTIIVGLQSSGKTTKAKELASAYLPEEVVWLEGFDDKHSIHRYCTQHTKLIIIEEIENIVQCVSFFGNLSKKIKVCPIGKESFIISPKLIFIRQIQKYNPRIGIYYNRMFPLYNAILCHNNQPQQ